MLLSCLVLDLYRLFMSPLCRDYVCATPCLLLANDLSPLFLYLVVKDEGHVLSACLFGRCCILFIYMSRLLVHSGCHVPKYLL